MKPDFSGQSFECRFVAPVVADKVDYEGLAVVFMTSGQLLFHGLHYLGLIGNIYHVDDGHLVLESLYRLPPNIFNEGNRALGTRYPSIVVQPLLVK